MMFPLRSEGWMDFGIAAAIGAALALLLGWALWARPLAALKSERDAARADGTP
jgi:hypothetical protein